MEPVEIKKELDRIGGELDSALQKHTAEIEKYGKATTELTGKVDELSSKYKETEAMLTELAQKQAEGFSKAPQQTQSIGEQLPPIKRVLKLKTPFLVQTVRR